MTRESSAESHILLANHDSIDIAMDVDHDVPASTPPTSISDSRSMEDIKGGGDDLAVQKNSGGRPKRVRSGVTNYNLKALSEAQLPISNVGKGRNNAGSRNASGLSGRTLVNRVELNEEDQEDQEPFVAKIEKALNPDWELPAGSPKGKGKSPAKVQRRPSVKDRVKSGVVEAGKKAAGKAGNLRTVLGKRGREMVESSKRALGMVDEEVEVPSPAKNKLLKELDLGKGGLLDEMDLDVDVPLPPRPTKRAKTTSTSAPLQELAQPTGPLQKTSDGKRVKKWQAEGLYVGQEANFDPAKKASKKLQKKSVGSRSSTAEEMPIKTSRLNFSLPMFDYLSKDRPFTIPFDVFAPSLTKGSERPKDWHKVNKNRLVGEARELWKKSENLPTSACVCKPPADGESGCDYDCLNRVMQYECNDKNCALDSAMCNNRAFAQLTARTEKAGAFDVGVEVVKTHQRGFGVRAARSFAPGQIIMEYTGEIISEGECQRRMREDYKDKECYYLMELERNLVIDGTRGSMSRFINHSCEPNCEVRMVKVNGTPRMGVFAGSDSGIMSGEELTYDYNFDNFGDKAQKCYCGTPKCRGTLSRRLNANELKKQRVLDEARRKVLAEEAAKKQREEAKKAEVEKSRGGGWRGWLAVDDPETKARLRAEKAAKEEAEKNSTRAARMARRRGSIGAAVVEKPVKAEPRRRKTMNAPTTIAVTETSAMRKSEEVQVKRSTSLSRTSTGSKFTEDLLEGERPSSKRSVLSKKTTVSVPMIDENSADDEIAVKPVAPKPQVIVKEVAVVGGAEEEDEDDEDVAMEDLVAPVEAAPKRSTSIKERIGKVVGKTTGRSAASGSASGSGGLRQSTLNFGKK